MTVDDYKIELGKIDALIDKMTPGVYNFLNDCIRIKNEVTQAITDADSITEVDATLEEKLNSFKKDIKENFNPEFIKENYYAIDSSIIFQLGRCEANFKNANTTDKMLTAIDAYLVNVQKAKDFLKDNGYEEEKFKGEAFKGIKTAIHEVTTHKASEVLLEIDTLQGDLKNAMKNHNDEDAAVVMAEIDKRLKKLNSTNRTLERLRKKNGEISPHQRSIKTKIEEVIQARNKTIVDTSFNSLDLERKLDKLKEAYRNETEAAGKGFLEKHKAKKEVKEAERELYGRRSRKKVETMLEERKAIVDAAKTMNIKNDRTYQREFLKTMKDLKAIDKKLIGRRATKQLYDGLKQKTGYLIGGTSLAIPSQIVKLNAVGKSK